MIFASLGIASFVLATSVPPVPLKDRVKGADHIFTGVATELVVVDTMGNVISNAPATTQIELGLKLTVVPKRILRTTMKTFPDKVVFTYGNGFILDVQWEKNRLLGKEMFYFLSGNFASVHALEFSEPMDKEKEIADYLNDKPAK